MQTSLKKQLDVAVNAAQVAMNEILAVYNSSHIKIEMKLDNSPLTIADRRAHNAICSILSESFPYPILSEEGTGVTPFSQREQWKSYWLVDPLDGTKEFIHKNGEFTVNIALITDNIPILGVVGVPVTGEIYYATIGQGSSLKVGTSLTKIKKRKPVDVNQFGLRVVASRSHMNEQTSSFINSLRGPQLVSIGSSLKFMAVAKGEADIYPRFVPSMEWDTAASHIIINEVGLEISNAFNNEPLRYNKKELLNPNFICR